MRPPFELIFFYDRGTCTVCFHLTFVWKRNLIVSGKQFSLSAANNFQNKTFVFFQNNFS